MSAPPLSERLLFVAGILVLVPLGLLTKVYAGPGSPWVTAYAGGALYEMCWVFLVLAAWPRLSVWMVCASVFLATCGIEFLQLWHPPLLTAARSTVLGQLVLGDTFGWMDFPFYLVGCVGACAAARSIRRHAGPLPT